MKRKIFGALLAVGALAAAAVAVPGSASADPDDPPVFNQISGYGFDSWEDTYESDSRILAWETIQGGTDDGEITFFVASTQDRDDLISEYGSFAWAHWEVSQDELIEPAQDNVYLDQSPYNPGLRWYLHNPNNGTSTGGCTLGWGWNPDNTGQWHGSFTNGEDYAITAGHCLDRDVPADRVLRMINNPGTEADTFGQWNVPSTRSTIDDSDSLKIDGNYYGDMSIAFIPGNKMATSSFYVEGDRVRIASPANGNTGDTFGGDICVFGQKTKTTRCGWEVVNDNNYGGGGALHTYERMSRIKLDTNNCDVPTNGDSGGLVFRKERAPNGDWIAVKPMGIISFVESQCTFDFHVGYTSIQVLDQLWPGQLINNP